ncbi:hypothetical protein A9Q84_16200 [Halobacteriovorax marinus]|uniref:histidine kinase n=1 Tax=Halobacteriovorax marinus TaxID=97084 RepID=A0A1Y5F494_9BACT|nr:hypothetical protein A9Q84_16200 [Halobacteriovorax marinus]
MIFKEKTSELFNSIPWRFFKRIALSQIILTTIVILITAFSARYFLKEYITNQSKTQVLESLKLIKSSIESQQMDPLKWCQSLKKNLSTRYSLIDGAGQVICDNFLDIKELDNHLYRPELQDATKLGVGTSVRYSDSASIDMIYGAMLIHVNEQKTSLYIRQAVPLEQIDIAMKDLDRSILISILPLLIITSLLSLYTSLQVSFPMRSLIRKISKLDSLKLTPKTFENSPSIDDEWNFVERTLDKAEDELGSFVEELKLQNKKFSILMESISDAILAIDNSGNILFMNKRFLKNFHSKERAIEIRELKNLKLIEVTRDREIGSLLTNAIKNKEILKKREVRLDMKGANSTGWFDITASPLFLENGEVLGAVCSFNNVSQKKLADQMREDFVTNVSHEVRTPLTAIKGYVQILQNSKDNLSADIAREALSKIEHNSSRLALLFQEILNLSVIESQQKIEGHLTSTRELTETVLMNMQQIHGKSQREIKTTYSAEEVWLDPALIEQVLTNLIDNAYKYGNDAGQISITWERLEHVVVLKIEDDGPGISSLHQARIFERFYRVDSSRSRNLGGTGLGLSIVKHIIQKHNGHIEVYANALKGTTFKISLPQKSI